MQLGKTEREQGDIGYETEKKLACHGRAHAVTDRVRTE